MAKLKGVKKLNKAVSAQLAPFGITSATLGESYAYYFDTERIDYTLAITAGDEYFNEFIKERFDYDVKLPFIISILHEVGHHKANDEIDGNIYDFCIAEKERIENAMAENEGNEKEQKKLEFQYFNLPDEIMATQWAVNFAKKHPRKVEKMWDKIAPVLEEFYKKNLNPEEFEILNTIA